MKTRADDRRLCSEVRVSVSPCELERADRSLLSQAWTCDALYLTLSTVCTTTMKVAVLEALDDLDNKILNGVRWAKSARSLLPSPNGTSKISQIRATRPEARAQISIPKTTPLQRCTTLLYCTGRSLASVTSLHTSSPHTATPSGQFTTAAPGHLAAASPSVLSPPTRFSSTYRRNTENTPMTPFLHGRSLPMRYISGIYCANVALANLFSQLQPAYTRPSYTVPV